MSAYPSSAQGAQVRSTLSNLITQVQSWTVALGLGLMLGATGCDDDVTPTDPDPDPGGGTGTLPGDFEPCPGGGAPCKILPLGDSITYGMDLSSLQGGGYRVELFRKALADDKPITFVGSLNNGPRNVDGVPFPRANEGHSGWTINQIANLIPRPALNDPPHIILLMAGTNDMLWSAGSAPGRFEQLLDKTINAAPDALIVVAQLTPLNFGNAAVQTFNRALPAIVRSRANAGKHVLLVDMFTGFQSNMLGDGVHPNARGYARMADVWYPAIAPYLR